MALVDWSFKDGKNSLNIDRKIFDEWICPHDDANVVWKKYHSGIPRPVPRDELIGTIADCLFQGYQWDQGDVLFRYLINHGFEDDEAHEVVGMDIEHIVYHERVFLNPIDELIMNALWWGCPQETDVVRIEVFEGGNGRIMRVQDQGKGFDVQQVLQRFVNNEQYWTNLGNGLKQVAYNPLIYVGWEDQGKTAVMHVPFPDGVPARSIGERIRVA